MLQKLEFKQVDVFTKTPCSGNPLAVIFEADELPNSRMQQVTKWTNLSEAVFFVKTTNPKADYKIKIFSPVEEIPFAGHPTIGAAYSAIEMNIVNLDDIIDNKNGILIQECNIGLVELKVTRHSKVIDEHRGLDISIAFKSPSPKFREVKEENKLNLLRSLKVSRSIENFKFLNVRVGIVWCIIQFPCPELLLSVAPDMEQLRKLSKQEDVTGFTCFSFYPGSESYEVRTFAPAVDVPEDPVCGSGNAAVSCFMSHVLGLNSKLSGRQGQKLGRDGQIDLITTKNCEANYISGQVITVVNGTIVV